MHFSFWFLRKRSFRKSRQVIRLQILNGNAFRAKGSMRLRLPYMLAGLLWLAPFAARADVFQADGVRVDLQIPQGFCALSRDNFLEKPHYDLQERMQAKINGVMLIALPCEEIEGVRAGKPWKRWVIWLLNGPPENHTKIPPGMSRPAVTEELARAMPNIDIDAISKQVGGSAAKEGIGLQLQTMSTIGQDDLALYTAQSANVKGGGAARQIAVVTGWIAMEGRLFTANAYADLESVATVEGLLSQIKDMVKRSAEKTAEAAGSTAK